MPEFEDALAGERVDAALRAVDAKTAPVRAMEMRLEEQRNMVQRVERLAAGLGDSNKINMAIQAWTDYSNYATGIGNSKAQQEADRELADLKARVPRPSLQEAPARPA